ncbi:hypothetical protein TNCV_1428561 [Trichonephila clavipes]|nr:hypothetical protein TNCV_1428561 [Trichonephila clavipes]
MLGPISRTDIDKPKSLPVNKKKCPIISGEYLLVDHSRDLTEGNVATFHCPPTYVLSGVNSTVCTRGGIWANPIPKCLMNSKRKLDVSGASEMNRLYPESRKKRVNGNAISENTPPAGEASGGRSQTRTKPE